MWGCRRGRKRGKAENDSDEKDVKSDKDTTSQ